MDSFPPSLTNHSWRQRGSTPMWSTWSSQLVCSANVFCVQFCWSCSVRLHKIGSGEFIIHFVLVLFWFSFVSAVWESKSQILFPPFSRMLVCLINTFKGLLVLRQYPWFGSECLVHLWSCSTMMMMAQLGFWEHDFLDEMMGMSLEKGLHAIFSHLPTMHLGQKKVRGRKNPWRTTGGQCRWSYFSCCCKWVALIGQDKSSPERSSVNWSTINADSLVKWKKLVLFYSSLFKFQGKAFDTILSFKDFSE